MRQRESKKDAGGGGAGDGATTAAAAMATIKTFQLNGGYYYVCQFPSFNSLNVPFIGFLVMRTNGI